MNEDIKQQTAIHYANAREWYIEKYLRNTYQILNLGLSILILLVGFYIMNDMLSFIGRKTTMRFPIYVENDSDEQHYIHNLSEPHKSINEVLASYMLKRYVSLRETYYPDLLLQENWSSTLMNIRSMSSHEVFESVLKKILPSQNHNSPIIRFRFSNTITPYIKSIKFSDFSGNKPIAANVFFDVMQCNENYEDCISKNFGADIKFEIRCDTHDFKFKVSYYMSYPLDI